MVNKENRAWLASRQSWACVHGKDREGWLSLMAEDVVIEDPIGKSPLDPVGKGHRGKEAVAKFWDTNIGPNAITIDVKQSFSGGDEVAHVMALTTTFSHGAKVRVEGIFTYAVNADGLIKAIRGYWEMSELVMLAR